MCQRLSWVPGAQTDLPTSRCSMSVFPHGRFVHITCTRTQLSIFVTCECMSLRLSPRAILLVPRVCLVNSFSKC